MNLIFGYCAVFFNHQICGLKYFSNPTSFSNYSHTQHTCEAADAPLKDPSQNETALILEIVLPCVIGTIAVAVGLIIFMRRRIRAEWFHFWSSHTREGTFHLASKDYFDARILVERRKKDHWEIKPGFLQIDEENPLGHGAFAIVYKAILKESVPLISINSLVTTQIEGKVQEGYEVAVKRLPNHADDQARGDFLKELDFMKALGYHTHIMSLLGCISNPLSPSIVVEFCHNGDLLHYLRRNKDNYIKVGIFFEKYALGWIWMSNSQGFAVFLLANQRWNGLSLLKKFYSQRFGCKKYSFDEEAGGQDFGLCREVDAALYSSQGGRLPIKWMAIESLKYYEYTSKSDVWSFGVLLFEIFSFGEGPFQAIQPADMIEHLEEGNCLERPESCPEEIYEIMKNSWNSQPNRRPTFEEIREKFSWMLHDKDSQYGYLSLIEEEVQI